MSRTLVSPLAFFMWLADLSGYHNGLKYVYYEVYPKSTGTRIINNLFKFQTTEDIAFSSESSSEGSFEFFIFTFASFFEKICIFMEGLFWNAPQFPRYCPLDGFHTFKTNPFLL